MVYWRGGVLVLCPLFYQLGLGKARQTPSLHEIYTAMDMAGINNLIASCGSPYWVGAVIAKSDIDDALLQEWIANHSDYFFAGKPQAEAIRGLFHALDASHALELVAATIEAGKQKGWEAEKIARCMLLAPVGKITWNKSTILATRWQIFIGLPSKRISG